MEFIYKLRCKDGRSADPATLHTAVPNWQAGDVIPLGDRSLHVVEVRDDDADQPLLLVVEDALPWQ